MPARTLASKPSATSNPKDVEMKEASKPVEEKNQESPMDFSILDDDGSNPDSPKAAGSTPAESQCQTQDVAEEAVEVPCDQNVATEAAASSSPNTEGNQNGATTSTPANAVAAGNTSIQEGTINYCCKISN